MDLKGVAEDQACGPRALRARFQIISQPQVRDGASANLAFDKNNTWYPLIFSLTALKRCYGSPKLGRFTTYAKSRVSVRLPQKIASQSQYAILTSRFFLVSAYGAAVCAHGNYV